MIDEGVPEFINLDTLKTVKVLQDHLAACLKSCPDAELIYIRNFSEPNSQAKKYAYLNKPVMAILMQQYIDKYLKYNPGPLPSPPPLGELLPIIDEKLNVLFTPPTKSSRTRKQRKNRKQSRKQQINRK